MPIGASRRAMVAIIGLSAAATREARDQMRPAPKSDSPTRKCFSPACIAALASADRKSVVTGKSVSVRVDIGCRRINKKQIKIQQHTITFYSIDNLHHHSSITHQLTIANQ